jgi:hypothetical protein
MVHTWRDGEYHCNNPVRYSSSGRCIINLRRVERDRQYQSGKNKSDYPPSADMCRLNIGSDMVGHRFHHRQQRGIVTMYRWH